ncbi:pfs domain-containing protein [Aspergillus unguis]
MHPSTSRPASRSLTHNDYTVAIICPRGIELAPVKALLDQTHPSLPTHRSYNTYILGRMGHHNVVLVGMHDTGNPNAAMCATQLRYDFQKVKYTLLVGTGGGIPDARDDIRLGDVVVSSPGAIQFDAGKVLQGGRFQRTGVIDRAPDALLRAIEQLNQHTQHSGSNLPGIVSTVARGNYAYPGAQNDHLYRDDYQHDGGYTHRGGSCNNCDPRMIVRRQSRGSQAPQVHFGTIGSSYSIVADRRESLMLKRELQIKCVEMEASGLMAGFPCLVVRGISNYADSHKNNRWQLYAAATAAAYAKEVLMFLPPVSTRAAGYGRLTGKERSRATLGKERRLPYR